MVRIREITKADYPNGKKVVYEYISDKYYDVCLKENEDGWHIELSLHHFDKPFYKYMEVEIFEEYIEDIECYIAEVGEKEVGIISFYHEKWNNVVRIVDIHINQVEQKKGIGSHLMALVKKWACQMPVSYTHLTLPTITAV